MNNGRTVLTQQFTKDEALRNFLTVNQAFGSPSRNLYFAIVDDPAQPGSVKIVNQVEANQGFILPYER